MRSFASLTPRGGQSRQYLGCALTYRSICQYTKYVPAAFGQISRSRQTSSINPDQYDHACSKLFQPTCKTQRRLTLHYGQHCSLLGCRPSPGFALKTYADHFRSRSSKIGFSFSASAESTSWTISAITGGLHLRRRMVTTGQISSYHYSIFDKLNITGRAWPG